FSGILGGLSGIGGLVGGAIGIGKSIFGGIKSLFGGKSKEEKAAEEARQKAWEDLSRTLEDQYGTLGELRDQAAKYGVDLSKAMDTKDAELMNKELAELEKRQKGLKNAAAGISKVIENIKPTTEAGAMAQAGLFSTVFWATVEREGLMAASESLRGAFDTLMEGASESMKQFLAPIATQMNLASNEAFAAAAEGAAGLAQAIKGMADAGIVSIQDMTNAGQVAMDAYNQALAAAHEEGIVGAAAQQAAIRTVGPAVAAIRQQYEALGLPIDANTQALIDQAEAAGMAFATDPMTRAANAMEQVAVALGKAFGIAIDLGGAMGGVAGQANRAAQATSRISVPQMPGGAPGPPPGLPRIPAQKGISPSVLGQDTVIQAHKGEGVMVVPRGEMSRTSFASAQQGIGHIPGPRAPSKGLVGTQYTPRIVNRPTVVVEDKSVVKTPEGQREFQKHTVEGIYKALDQNANGLARRMEYQQRTRCRSRI
ncbi:MAG: zinc ribbon domain-containing protein, partial [Planctomycetota bacterium]